MLHVSETSDDIKYDRPRDFNSIGEYLRETERLPKHDLELFKECLSYLRVLLRPTIRR
jgi:hypothetical protein